MSIWLPKRDANGRWHMYSVGVPWQLIVPVPCLLVALIVVMLVGNTPDARPSFYVHGRFDISHTGEHSERDRDRVESLIKVWGGVIAIELDDSVDYLVLGVEPSMPDPPDGEEIDPQVIASYIAEQENHQRYGEFKSRADELNITILNQNELLQKVGYTNHDQEPE